MRCQNNFFTSQKRIVLGWRLFFVNIERETGKLATFDRCEGCFFIYQTTTSAVYDAHAVFHIGEALRINHMRRLWRFRHVKRNEISLLGRFINRFAKLNPHCFRAACGQIRIKSHDFHSKSHRTTSELASDSAHAQTREGVVVKLNAFVGFAAFFEVAFHH